MFTEANKPVISIRSPIGYSGHVLCMIKEKVMAIATERVPVLMSPGEKKLFADRARQAGCSLGEFFRRAASTYQAKEDDDLLDRLIGQMHKTTVQAEASIEAALAFVEASNQRIAAMESARDKL
jgi:hypothetical protein